MAASVTVLWLVAALLGGAFSLKCYHCKNDAGINCAENEKTCEATNDACVTTMTEIRQEEKGAQPKTVKQLVKSCGEKKFCNQTYSMSFGSTKLSASTKCCETDKCQSGIPEVKSQDKETQQKCPICAGLIDKCSDTETTSCYGDQNKCVSFKSNNGTLLNVQYTWKGCVTANVCDMKTIPTLPMSHMLGTMPDCSRSPSLLPGMLAPMAFGLAFLKLLL